MTVALVIPVKDEDPGIVTEIRRQCVTQGFGGTGGQSLVIVDDGSTHPVKDAEVRHETPRGYGAALKSGIRYTTADYIVTMDGDGQHHPFDAKRLIDFLRYFPENQMVIGDRRLHESQPIRWVGRKLLNTLAGLFAWHWIPDLNSGMRIFERKAAIGYEPILCNGFSFTTSLTLAMMADGYTIDWLPIKVAQRPLGKSRVKLFRDGWVTLKYIVWIGSACRTRRLRRVWRGCKDRLHHRLGGVVSLPGSLQRVAVL